MTLISPDIAIGLVCRLTRLTPAQAAEWIRMHAESGAIRASARLEEWIRPTLAEVGEHEAFQGCLERLAGYELDAHIDLARIMAADSIPLTWERVLYSDVEIDPRFWSECNAEDGLWANGPSLRVWRDLPQFKYNLFDIEFDRASLESLLEPFIPGLPPSAIELRAETASGSALDESRAMSEDEGPGEDFRRAEQRRSAGLAGVAQAGLTISEARLRLAPLWYDRDPWQILYDRLESEQVPAFTTCAAPAHPDPRLSGLIEPTGDWFRHNDATGQRGSEEWSSWFLNGGVLLDEAAVARLEDELLGQQLPGSARAALDADVWPLLETIAWIATRNASAVAMATRTAGPLGSLVRTARREAFVIECLRRKVASESATDTELMPPDDALAALRSALRADRIQATVVGRDGSSRGLHRHEVSQLKLGRFMRDLPELLPNRVELLDRDGPVELVVEEVTQIWPGTETRALAQLPTGDPGRPPKGRELYLAEFHRRAAAGSLLPTLKAEASALREWFAAMHPLAVRPQVGTIENNIRADWNRHLTHE